MSSTPAPASVSAGADKMTVGSSTLAVKWNDSESGTVACWRDVFVSSERSEMSELGELDFGISALDDFAQWEYLHDSKPGLDGAALCVVLQDLASRAKQFPGVGAACIYGLATVAERKNIKHMIVSDAVASAFGFYEKMGFVRFDLHCFDFYGETAAVKYKAQQSASKH